MFQVQATVVGLLAAVAAILLGALSKGYVELDQAAVLCASSVTTAFIAALSLGKTLVCFCPNYCWLNALFNSVLHFCPLGLVMVGVIIASRKLGINPDNVATPIAASLGDLITLSLLAGISSFLFRYKGIIQAHQIGRCAHCVGLVLVV